MKKFLISLFFGLLSLSAFSQGYSIEFQVKDSNGNPIAGATARIKGSQNGSTSDLDGYVTIDNVEPSTKIVVSFIGHETVEKTVAQIESDNYVVVLVESRNNQPADRKRDSIIKP